MTNQIASNLRNILQRIQDAALKQTTNVSSSSKFYSLLIIST